MEFVTWIDTLRTIACEKVLIELQARNALHHRQTLFFGNARVDSGFIHYHIAFRDDLAHRFGGTDQGGEIRTVIDIDGGRHGDYIEIAVTERLKIGSTLESVVTEGILKQLVGHFKRSVMAAHQGIHTGLVHIESYSFKLR